MIAPVSAKHCAHLMRIERNKALEAAATLVELEYAADKKMADRLKMIAQHIRNMKIKDAADA